ncbi:MAG: fibronectin type III domain-containing protein [Candidatus Aminicenantes bacterium]|nr:fibronectin type III domain-containing protein [Candidatus Aminicenantes bacterium]
MKKFIILSILVSAVLGFLWPGSLRATSAPKVTTLAAADIQATSATLKGTVDPGGLRTDLYFISCDPTSSASFFTQTPTKWTDGTTAKSATQAMTGLKPNTAYRYAVTAMNSMGKVTGTCVAFTTKSSTTTLPPAGSAPAVTTLAATEVTSATATLNATVNPNGVATKVNFKSCAASSNPAYFAPTSMKDVAAATTPQTVGYRLSGLKPGLTYRYAVQASSAGGNKVGDCIFFTTPGQAAAPAAAGKPDVTTMPASNVGTSSATINGRVNPKGLATTYSFASGTDDHDLYYFPATATKEAGSGNSSLNVTANISGLTPNMPYKFRIRAKNSAGEVLGALVSFTTGTASGPPSVETNPAVAILGTSATLEGTLNPNGTKTDWFFISCDDIYAPSYFVPTPTRPESAGTTPRRVFAEIENLKPKTTYRYALKATNSQGSKTGKCVTFTTLAAQAARPAVMGSPAKNISATSAVVEGYVNPNGVATTVWFNACAAGPSEAAYFPPTPEQVIGNGIEQKKVSASLTGLFPGQTYKVQAWARNSIGSAYGECFSFTTTGQQGIVVQTQPAQSVTPTSALLVAKANPNKQNDIRIKFVQSGTGSGHFDPTSAQSLYPYQGLQSVTKIVTGLNPGTRYGYCAVGWGPDGKEVRGATVWFTTLSSGVTGPPTAITEAAQNIAWNGAELRAIISPNGLPTTYYFEAYKPYPNSTPAFPSTQPTDCGSSGSNLTRYGGILGLAPNTTYQYRVVAKNSKGTVRGEYVTFKTTSNSPAAPSETRRKRKGKSRNAGIG